MKYFYHGWIRLTVEATYQRLLSKKSRTIITVVQYDHNGIADNEEDALNIVAEWGEAIKESITGRFCCWDSSKYNNIKRWNNGVSEIHNAVTEKTWRIKDWKPFTVKVTAVGVPNVRQLTHEQATRYFTTQEIFEAI